MPVLRLLVQFADVQAYKCLKRIQNFKYLFWYNDTTSCCKVDEVGPDHNGKISEVDMLNALPSREMME